MSSALDRFSPAVRDWFSQTFAAPSPAQELAWPAIAAGEHTLVCAPTGSGKTLAAFLWSLERLVQAREPEERDAGIHTVYVSPLKALGYDVERNLRAPLAGIGAAAERRGERLPPIRVAVRTGDTTAAQRAAMLRRPPHLLITTPESLFILLTSPRPRELLSGVRTIIVDEIHAIHGNKRGSSLALSLEQLTRLAGAPVRIGLSATLRDPEQASRLLGGAEWVGEELRPRRVTIVDAGLRKELDLQVAAPVPDFAALHESVWPEVQQRLLGLIRAHRSTLVFVRMRAQAERISRALNDLEGSEVARAHHGSLSAPLRRELEEQLKRGELRALVSTGTMELGIDMGAIDLVVQVGSPGSAMSGLQRVGRAGHLLRASSRGRLIPLHREDLLECAVIARRMLEAQVEAQPMPRNALDVLAQHVLSAVAVEPWTGDELWRCARQAAPYRDLTRQAFDSVLHLLAGRYPAEVARGLTAKLVWERSTDRLSALRGARQLVTTAGGTIPDQGYYSLQTAGGTKLGELEEEFVFERRLGDVISFGSSTWRIIDIDRQRVHVVPAPGQPAVIPFWKGGLFGRDPELSEALGAFRRELFERVADRDAARAWLRAESPLDDAAAENLTAYFAEQRRKGHALGTDRTIVVEAFQDDLGDHRVVVHSPFGNRINAPWALALRRQLRASLGVDPQVMTDDNAILVRSPAGEAPPPLELLQLVESENVEELVLTELEGSAMYGSVFRQNAARFLVLGRKGAFQRSPLWLQRLRAKDLLEATSALTDFPVRLETFRECLQDIMDLPRLERLLQRIERGEIEIIREQTRGPSPVAAGVLNRFIGQYMYEYDEPRGERTLRRLQLDRSLLEQVLGRGDVSRLLLPEAVEELQGRWQGRAEHSRARDAEELLGLVLRLVSIPEAELPDRCAGDPGRLVEGLLREGRLVRLRRGPAPRAWLCAAEDLPLLARADRTVALEAGSDPPQNLDLDPAAARELLLERVLDSLGPVTLEELARRAGLPRDEVQQAAEALVQSGRLMRGQFVADAESPAFCTRHNLQQIRRRSLTLARRQVEPVDCTVLQQLVLELQHVGHEASGAPSGPSSGGRPELAPPERLLSAIDQLALLPLPIEVLERDLLPSRVEGYQPRWLDELVASGELLWTGAGPRRISLLPRQLDLRQLVGGQAGELSPGVATVEAALASRGASFLQETVGACGLPLAEVQRALWQLVWAGRATNDHLEALRRGLLTSFEPPELTSAVNPLTGRASSFGRPRRGRRWQRELPTAWSGRWSLLPPAPALGPDAARELVWLLVRRYGLVARELLGPGPAWSELYPVLREMELAGELGRGVFVRGLAAAQFAPAETVDRLRALRDSDRSPDQQPGGRGPLLLSACDPALIASAVGAGLPAGATLVRRPSTYVVLDQGRVVLVAESAGRSIYLDEGTGAPVREPLAALLGLLRRGLRGVRIERVNGGPVLSSFARGPLEELGLRADGPALEKRRYS